jgi:hypothetical protein
MRGLMKRSLNTFLTHVASKKNKGGNKMKKLLLGTIFLALAAVAPIQTMAGVDISIGISLPPLIEFAAPPEVVVIPVCLRCA